MLSSHSLPLESNGGFPTKWRTMKVAHQKVFVFWHRSWNNNAQHQRVNAWLQWEWHPLNHTTHLNSMKPLENLVYQPYIAVATVLSIVRQTQVKLGKFQNPLTKKPCRPATCSTNHNACAREPNRQRNMNNILLDTDSERIRKSRNIAIEQWTVSKTTLSNITSAPLRLVNGLVPSCFFVASWIILGSFACPLWMPFLDPFCIDLFSMFPHPSDSVRQASWAPLQDQSRSWSRSNHC